MSAVLKPSRRWPLLLIPLLLAAVLGQGGSDRLDAHALLVRADPPVNAQLPEPPSQLSLFFSEPLEQRFSTVRVVNQLGERVDERVEFDETDDAAMHVFLAEVGPGFLTVNWETVSTVDGHRITGSYPLTILNEDGSIPPGQPASGESVSGEEPDPLRVFTKAVLLVAGALLTGALAFLAFILPGMRGDAAEGARTTFGRWATLTAFAALAVLAIAGFADLALQALDIDARISDVLDTRWGERWLFRSLLLVPIAILVAGLYLRLANRQVMAAAALLCAAGYMVLTSSVSHAAAGGGSFWAVTTDFVHLLAASVWIGLLGLLLVLFLWTRRNLPPSQRYPIIAVALQRFSILALASVALLLFTGTISAVIEVGRFADLLETGYGRTLLIKLLLLVPLLAIAGYNAYLLRPDFVEAAESRQSGRDRQGLLAELEAQLNRRVAVEFGLAVVVLAVVALLVQLTPSRGRIADPEQGAGEFLQTLEEDNLQATLVIEPNEPGNNTFSVYLAGGVDVVESLRLEFVQPGGFAGDSRLILEPSNPPTFYIGQGPFISEPGNWTVILNIRRQTGTDLRLAFPVEVQGPAAPVSEPRSGGAFDAPFPSSATIIALITVSGVVALVIVLGSISRPGLPEGYLGWVATEVVYRLAPLNVRPVWSLGLLIALGIVAGYVVSTHVDPPLSPEEASRENPIPATQESIDRGRMLFMNNCTICHGESGRGDGPAADTLPIPPANLYDHIPFHPDQFFFGVISKGLSGVMPAFEGEISEEDRWNILNYLRDRFTKQPVEQ